METPLNFFRATYVINLDKRTDRWTSIQHQLTTYGFPSVQRVSACRPDISHITTDNYANFHYGSDRWESFEGYLRGAVGCLQSHIKVLETAIQAELDNYLVFEDDTILEANSHSLLGNALKTLQQQPDWDMFYLGGRHRSRRKPVTVSENLLRIRCTYQTHAYAVNRPFYTILLHALNQCKAEIDHFYAEKIHPKHRVFCCHPAVAIQSDSQSDITQQQPLSEKNSTRQPWLKKLVRLIRNRTR
ncbi:hypothetical protein CI610_01897 [invertebrate metagenome]|uniref:Glycosyl transferase family 25 domain-containing protein n=1 Tax=invertebrate metagenome TaxID=1711999 RepID=A0A2H9T7J2_9ZZZZ